MANLFIKQAASYVQARTTYPKELFQFISSKTQGHDLVWDVGTGNGQAAVQLAGFYKEVVATDTSATQLAAATKRPNICYQQTPPVMTMAELTQVFGAEPRSSVELVTVAQALHWFDLPNFYSQVKHVLKPDGVLAAWCYTIPEVDEAVDTVFWQFYKHYSAPYWAPERRIVDDQYKSIEFPFETVEGESHTGPFRFTATKNMDLDLFLTYLRSQSAYITSREKGVELLNDEVLRDFETAWGNGLDSKLVRFPVHLRIGRITH